jgi:hypothetical protein
MLQLEERASRLDFCGKANVELVTVDDAARLQTRGAREIDEMQSVGPCSASAVMRNCGFRLLS